MFDVITTQTSSAESVAGASSFTCVTTIIAFRPPSPVIISSCTPRVLCVEQPASTDGDVEASSPDYNANHILLVGFLLRYNTITGVASSVTLTHEIEAKNGTEDSSQVKFYGRV